MIIAALGVAALLSAGWQTAEGGCDGKVGHWAFPNIGDDVAAPPVPPDKQAEFKLAFCKEIKGVEGWAAKVKWPLPALPPLAVFVLVPEQPGEPARSLVPAWQGHRGLMFFQSPRVAAGTANIAHELGHVYFPNSNRMLAEGLAVYLQDEVGSNRAFPNDGRPVHEITRCKVSPESRTKIDMLALDGTVVPTRLKIDFGPDSAREAFAYIFAGSFVRYLIDTHGMDKFTALYERTPLAPGREVGRRADDWREIYGAPLADLVQQWKTAIEQMKLNCTAPAAGGTATP